MIEQIRQIISEVGELQVDVASLAEDDDLYKAGLTSFATVQVMLGLEQAFDIELPEHLLNRSTFSSMRMIEAALSQVTSQ